MRRRYGSASPFPIVPGPIPQRGELTRCRGAACRPALLASILSAIFGALLAAAALVLPQHAVTAQETVDDPRRVALEQLQTLPPFLVRVDVDHPDRVYRGGETIQVSVRSEQSGHLYLFYCDASGQVSCLFPNQVQRDNRIPAEQTLIIPDQSSGFRLRVGPPYGQEILKAIVTTQPLQTLEVQALTKGDITSVAPQKFKGVFVELREEGTTPAAAPSGPGARRWSEHDVQLTTLAPEAELPQRSNLSELVPAPAGTDLQPASGTASTRPDAAGETSMPARVGVFIGISKYQDPQIRPLTVADDDARAMAQWFEQHGGLTQSVVLIDEHATLANIQQLIQVALPAATRPGDVIFLYWSGHGGRISNVDGTEPDGFDEYLVPHDGRLEPAEAIRRTMLLDKTFGRWVQNLDGRKLVVILDACHSGGQTQGARKALAGDKPEVPFRDFFFQNTLRRVKDIGQRETAVLASSRATQLSFEQRGGKLSVMTGLLIERLQSGDEPICLADAAEHVLQRVPEFVRQHYPGTTQTPIFVDYTTPPIYLRPSSP